MKRVLLSAALLLALGPGAHAAAPESFEARVIGVADGDTITVQVSDAPPYEIRLAGIDAPERKGGQAYSVRSKDNLSDWVYQKTVRIEWAKKDGYGRIVGKVLIGTQDVNLAQLAVGMAWHYKHYEEEQSPQDRQAYAIAERNARDQKLGLWKDAHPVPPWDWRHGSNAGSAGETASGPVKKSRNNICHDPSMPTYESVKNFTSYPTLDACVASGARLPKPP